MHPEGSGMLASENSISVLSHGTEFSFTDALDEYISLTEEGLDEESRCQDENSSPQPRPASLRAPHADEKKKGGSGLKKADPKRKVASPPPSFRPVTRLGKNVALPTALQQHALFPISPASSPPSCCSAQPHRPRGRWPARRGLQRQGPRRRRRSRAHLSRTAAMAPVARHRQCQAAVTLRRRGQATRWPPSCSR